MIPVSKSETIQQRALELMSDKHLRVCVVGNVDAGKSSLIGTLKSSDLDNGKGLSRSKITKHMHEIVTGRTSTISQHAVGFVGPTDNDGRKVETLPGCPAEDEIAKKASRVVTLMDLAGHEKYFKTTIAGLSMGMADYALVLVNASQPPTHMTMHHLKLCTSCGIPVIVIMTKVDSCPSHVYQHSKKKVIELLRSPDIGKRQYAIRNTKDIDTVKDKMHILAPLLSVSCVTGEGLDLLKQLLYVLPKRRQHQNKKNRPFEFLVEELFYVKGVGTVLSGFVNAGEWKKGQSLQIGPMKDGTYVKAVVRSAHVARTEVDQVWAGHSACFAVSSMGKIQRSMLKKGMVALIASLSPPPAVQTFQAEICILKGESVTMTKGRYRATAHILQIKKAAKVVDIDPSTMAATNRVSSACSNGLVLRPGDQACVTFRFMGGPAYVRKGMRVILRERHVRAIGVVVSTDEGKQKK